MVDDPFEVEVSPVALKGLRRAPNHVVVGFGRALQDMARDPFRQRPGFDCRWMHGYPRTYRLRLGTWRMTYVVDQDRKVVRVTSAGPRATIYRP